MTGSNAAQASRPELGPIVDYFNGQIGPAYYYFNLSP